MIAMNVISILYVIFKLYQDLFYPIYPWIYISRMEKPIQGHTVVI